MSGERVLRNTTTTTVALVIGILLVLGAADAVRYALQHPGTFSSKRLGDQWLLTVILLVFSAYLIRLWRSRVVVTTGSPTFLVKNVLRTHEIAWSDVEGIEERKAMWGGGPYGGGRSWVIKVRLHDGSAIRCSALGGVGLTPLGLSRELESILAREKAGIAAPSAPRGT